MHPSKHRIPCQLKLKLPTDKTLPPPRPKSHLDSLHPDPTHPTRPDTTRLDNTARPDPTRLQHTVLSQQYCVQIIAKYKAPLVYQK
jgi:hypothetical protein